MHNHTQAFTLVLGTEYRPSVASSLPNEPFPALSKIISGAESEALL